MRRQSNAKAQASQVTRTTICISVEAYRRLSVTALMEGTTCAAVVERAILDHCRSWSLPGKIPVRGTQVRSAEIDDQASESVEAAA
jgi:hypothetical protein